MSGPAPQKIRSFQGLLALARKATDHKRLVLAAADTEEGLKCVHQAQRRGLIEPVLVGDRRRIRRLCRGLKISLAGVELVDVPDPQQAARRAVAMCRRGQADILMKGNVHTAVILRAILDRDKGLGQGGLLSNTTVFESPRERRLMFMADPAVNINPDVTRKVEIIRNAVWVAQRLGFARPRGPFGAHRVKQQGHPLHGRGGLDRQDGSPGADRLRDIAGPIPLDVAVSRQAAKYKQVTGPVAGRADILICPELNSANVLYKALIHLAGREVANAMIGVQTKTPLVMNSARTAP